jgi:hypothetical protein
VALRLDVAAAVIAATGTGGRVETGRGRFVSEVAIEPARPVEPAKPAVRPLFTAGLAALAGSAGSIVGYAKPVPNRLKL